MGGRHRFLAGMLLLGNLVLGVACGDDQAAGTASTGSGSGEGAGGCFASFDGVDDGLFVDAGAHLAKTSDFSVSAFVRPGTLAVGAVAFIAGRHADGSSNGFYLALANEGGQTEARFIVFTGESTCAPAGAVNWDSGSSLHLLGSLDGNTARIFVDGNQVAELACGSGTVIEPASVFSIGRSESGVFPFQGAIDEVAYYARATSTSFQAAELGCDGAELRLSFDNTPSGAVDTISTDCGAIGSARVGTSPDSDEADPTFACP